MKKVSLLLASVLFLAVAAYSYAVNYPIGGFRDRTASGAGTAAGVNYTNHLQNLKTRADNEIQRRIDVLNKLLTKVGDARRLSPAEASSFDSQVQAEITALNTLKAKIDADTDMTTLRADVQSIITSYRVFAFFIVDINLTVTADKMNTLLNNMTLVYNKLQFRIQKQQAAGKNVTNLNTLLSDMNINISNAKTIIQSVQTELAGLSVQGYPGNKSTLMDVRQKLKMVFSDIKSVFSDGKQIIQGLEDNGRIQNNNLGRDQGASQNGNSK